MNPTVIAAAIGVSGTMLVGAAGVWGSVCASGTALRGVRERRIWDQQASVYVDAIAAVNFRQTNRRRHTSRFRDPWENEADSVKVSRNYIQPEWFQVEARLLAFGSDEVNNALRAGSFLHADAIDAHQAYLNAPPGVDKAAARKLMEKQVDAADECLVDLINAELRGAKAAKPWRGVMPPDPG